MTTASPSSTQDRAKLEWLQIGRAVAAMLVVFHHADQASAHFLGLPGQRYFGWGAYGVDFFFVLSGFIIFYAHRKDAPGLAPARRYGWKRLTRIYLPYLPIAIAWMGLLLLFQGGQEARNWSVLATLTLLPLATVSALSVAWTLTYELIFYAFFLLRYLAKIAMVVAGAPAVPLGAARRGRLRDDPAPVVHACGGRGGDLRKTLYGETLRKSLNYQYTVE